MLKQAKRVKTQSELSTDHHLVGELDPLAGGGESRTDLAACRHSSPRVLPENPGGALGQGCIQPHLRESFDPFPGDVGPIAPKWTMFPVSRNEKEEDDCPTTETSPDHGSNPLVTPKPAKALIKRGRGGSSVVKYKITATPGGPPSQQNKPVRVDGQEVRFFTPVRRSVRIERASLRYPPSLQDHDVCVSSYGDLISEEGKETCEEQSCGQTNRSGNSTLMYIYRENEALGDKPQAAADRRHSYIQDLLEKQSCKMQDSIENHFTCSTDIGWFEMVNADSSERHFLKTKDNLHLSLGSGPKQPLRLSKDEPITITAEGSTYS
ncbi:hypothetical protein CRENBAI_001160 [Crenichthys baileyi]|uniref:Cytoskeleton-associated protein 2 C-terminal domain-containing protein n=1 Tax=Crenichthys baileyi TaxID=28760 RepID=A0AAV9RVR7_9TELE